MRAILTGASGFIGGRLRDALIDQGHDVLALRRRASAVPKRGRSAEVEYEDLASLEQIVQAEKPSFIFHVAGATKGVTYEDFRLANVLPTENLLQAVRVKHPGVQ